MADTDFLQEIVKTEQQQRKKHQEFMEVSKKICELRQKIHAADIKHVKHEKELHGLLDDCNSRTSQVEINEAKIAFIKVKATESKISLNEKKKCLDEIQRRFWHRIGNFTKISDECLRETERRQYTGGCLEEAEARDRERHMEENMLEEVLVLQGEIEALKVANEAAIKMIGELSHD